MPFACSSPVANMHPFFIEYKIYEFLLLQKTDFYEALSAMVSLLIYNSNHLLGNTMNIFIICLSLYLIKL